MKALVSVLALSTMIACTSTTDTTGGTSTDAPTASYTVSNVATGSTITFGGQQAFVEDVATDGSSITIIASIDGLLAPQAASAASFLSFIAPQANTAATTAAKLKLVKNSDGVFVFKTSSFELIYNPSTSKISWTVKAGATVSSLKEELTEANVTTYTDTSGGTKIVDTDGDGTPDVTDTDDDGDGVVDTADAFPLDRTETLDTDGEGRGNNSDTDDDGDNVADTIDAFPLDRTETLDTDGDGTGNNADTDDDGDGVADTADAFPLDRTESADFDGDGVGNNSETTNTIGNAVLHPIITSIADLNLANLAIGEGVKLNIPSGYLSNKQGLIATKIKQTNDYSIFLLKRGTHSQMVMGSPDSDFFVLTADNYIAAGNTMTPVSFSSVVSPTQLGTSQWEYGLIRYHPSGDSYSQYILYVQDRITGDPEITTFLEYFRDLSDGSKLATLHTTYRNDRTFNDGSFVAQPFVTPSGAFTFNGYAALGAEYPNLVGGTATANVDFTTKSGTLTANGLQNGLGDTGSLVGTFAINDQLGTFVGTATGSLNTTTEQGHIIGVFNEDGTVIQGGAEFDTLMGGFVAVR